MSAEGSRESFCFPLSHLEHGCDIWSHSSCFVTMKKEAGGKAKKIMEILAGIPGRLQLTLQTVYYIRKVNPCLFKPVKGFLLPAAEYIWYIQASLSLAFLLFNRLSQGILMASHPPVHPDTQFLDQIFRPISWALHVCIHITLGLCHRPCLVFCLHLCCITNWL